MPKRTHTKKSTCPKRAHTEKSRGWKLHTLKQAHAKMSIYLLQKPWKYSKVIQLKLMYWWGAYFLLQVALWKPQRNFHESSSTKGRASLYGLDRIRHTTLVNIWGYAKHALCTLGWKLSNTSEIVRRCTALPFWKTFTEAISTLILSSIFCVKNKTSCQR